MEPIEKLDLDYLRTTQPPVEALIAMARTVNALIDASGHGKKADAKSESDAEKDKMTAKAGDAPKAGDTPKASEAKPKPA